MIFQSENSLMQANYKLKTLITTMFQAVKGAIANPVKSLRME
jgi:hypothetical protein